MSSIKSIRSTDIANDNQYMKKIYKSPNDRKFEKF